VTRSPATDILIYNNTPNKQAELGKFEIVHVVVYEVLQMTVRRMRENNHVTLSLSSGSNFHFLYNIPLVHSLVGTSN